MREPPNVPEEHLRAGLGEHFGLTDVSLEFLPVGLDANAGVYRVRAARGADFLLKVKRGPIYPASCLAPRHLVDQGAAEVVAPLPTTHGDLWSAAGASSGWVLTLYPFIEGVTGWAPAMTDQQWRAIGAAVRRIQQTPLPPQGIPSLRVETWPVAQYAAQVRALDARYTQPTAAQMDDLAERALIGHWSHRWPAILTMLAAMEQLAATLRRRSGQHVICHADLHPSNIIRDGSDGVHIIDWDDVMLAPKERDYIFVADMPVMGDDAMPAFFQGYGAVEVDWVALTYYRFERVITDVIASAQEVSFFPELSESDRDDSAARFDLLFAPGDMLDMAWALAANLPPDLRIARDTVP